MIARKIVCHPWEEWFAWYPVPLSGKYVWGKVIYRRVIEMHTDNIEFKNCQYGTLFDVLIHDCEE